MPEAMKKIREELGSDAVILSSKVVQIPGFLGFFKRKGVEVIAAIDPSPPVPKQPVIQEKSRKLPENTQKKNVSTYVLDTNNIIKEEYQNPDMFKELKELKALVKDLSSDVATNFEKYPEPLNQLNEILLQQEFNETIRQEIMVDLLDKWYSNNRETSIKDVQDWLREDLEAEMENYQFGGMSFKKKYISVVGPTGVGKTTTLAKIAADCMLKQNKKVAFITTDTYRIAAIEQLKTYAKILGVPIEICYNIEDFRKAKEKLADYDVLLIDTAGRNFRNEKYVKDLKEMIDFDEEMETFLVLSLTSKLSDMMEIYKQFSLVKIDKFIFTKVDETSNYGAMVNLILQYQKGVAYITNGQNVPDDIVLASPKSIVNLVLGVDGK